MSRRQEQAAARLEGVGLNADIGHCGRQSFMPDERRVRRHAYQPASTGDAQVDFDLERIRKPRRRMATPGRHEVFGQVVTSLQL
jgi:hypothetical protein